MHSLTYGRSQYTAPQSWAECTEAQRVALVPFCVLKEEDRTDVVEMEACRIWLGVSEKAWQTWRLSRWQWGNLRGLFAWVFEKPTDRPFERFEWAGISYLVAKPGMADATAIDVAWSNLNYLEFVNPESPSPAALDELVATLCRPRRADLDEFRASDDWNGDERQPFNEQRISEQAQAIADLPFAHKVAVLLYFEAEMKTFLEAYGELFGGGTETEPRYAGGVGWVMMLKNIAKAGHFGTFDQVCRQPAHLVWSAALDDSLDARDQQAAQEAETQRQNGYQPA